jgi:glucose-6-phosphate-specific signal transduction histidine kinase
MAEKHWREHRPKMVREMERKGILHQMLLEAENNTKDEMAMLRTQLMGQGSTAQQAQSQAWEMVREKYILLPSEE